MTTTYYQYLINKKPVKLKKMKNFEATRSKIKNYLNALKERFSTSEWKEFKSNELCKEFSISVTLPQILKSEGYYHYEHKNGVPSMMLSQKIMMLSEVTAHNKIREYCNQSKERIAIKELQNKEKNKLKKKRLEAKAINKAKKEEYLQNKLNFNRLEINGMGAAYGKEGYKTISIKVGRNFYESILLDCEKKGISANQWVIKKLVADNREILLSGFDESQEPPREQSIAEIKESLLKNPEFKDSFKKSRLNYDRASIYKSVKPIRQANELMEKLDKIEGAYYPKTIAASNQEVLKMVTKYHEPVIEQTDAETKIKSLETIMNLFLKGIINTEELENLKKGILNK
jgi:hypothetical protein